MQSPGQLPESFLASGRRPTFEMPPRIHRADGVERKVGIEIEFGGIDVGHACQLVHDLYGGMIEQDDRFGARVRDSRWGDFRVEIDSQPLKEHRYRSFLERVHAGPGVTDWVENVLETLAKQWIPSEIVCPPIPIRDVHVTESLRQSLREHHANGTHVSPLYTFAFQINPEAPALDASTLGKYLKAFLALQDWLFAITDVDRTRRITAFVDPFEAAYRQRVLEPSYAPDMDALIDDYLEANATRNRALDLLPLFASVDEKRVLERAREPAQIKSRPTFHYRLPNCLVNEPTWSFATEWNRWVEVERLAEDDARLESVSREALSLLQTSSDRDRAFWLAQGRSWGIRVE